MGGSGGGSGGSSGQVSYPAYMETQHEAWLTAVDGHMTTALTGDNPYTSATAYDPDCVLNATNYIISLFYDEVIALNPATDFDTYYTQISGKYSAETITAISEYTYEDLFSDANLTTLVNVYQADLEARRDNDFKPAYKVGMQNVNAVMSSAFVVGDALITAEVARNVAKFSGDLYFQNEQKKLEYANVHGNSRNVHNANVTKRDSLVVEQAVRNRDFNLKGVNSIHDAVHKTTNFYQALAHLTTEANRVKIIAKNEEADRNLDYDVKDALYDLEVYQYGGNVLASIAGAAAATKGKEVSTMQSVLGGAISGAAAGAMVGGAPGAAVGAVVGGLSGLL